MIKFISVVIVLFTVCYTNAELSAEDRRKANDALYRNNGTIQGDMRLSKDQKAKLRNRVATGNLFARWPNGEIPYVIDDSLSQISDMISRAADHIAEMTGNYIRWIPQTNEETYIRMFQQNGCWSMVGKVQDGAQDLSLGQGCEYFGTVVHEMLHAVGFDHEQNRPDRDTYLNIFRENIQEGMENNFDVLTDGLIFTDFDWDSVMLYGETAFSKDGQSPTMQDRRIGQIGEHRLTEPYDKPGMTEWDAYQVKKFYECV